MIESLYSTATAAVKEARRRQALHGTMRDRYRGSVALVASELASLDIGKVVTIKHPRFGLATGGDFVVVASGPDAKAQELEIGGWK